MCRSKLTFISYLLCLEVIFHPANVFAQAFRAGIIAASNSIYREELRGIREALQYRLVTPKQNYFKTRKPPPKVDYKTSESSLDKALTFDELRLPETISEPPPHDHLTSSETELNSKGWERF